MMELKGCSLKEATDHVIFKQLKEGDGGVVAVDKDGNIAMPFNRFQNYGFQIFIYKALSLGMFRGCADSKGRYEIGIRHDDDE
jgi:hypothetical protein